MISVGVQTWGTDVPALERYWAAVEDLGFDRVTYGDGLWDFTHDGWTMLGALATLTRRVRLGPAVTYAFGPSSHHPSWLAKRAVTVDHLSAGRLDLRLGVGAEEAATARVWRSHGIAYPSAARRLALLEESLDVVRALWSGDPASHTGATYRLDAAQVLPRPVQRPGPPVWIAAMGPRALDLVARRADAWEASYLVPEDFAARWEILQRRLAAAGRTGETFGRSVELDVALAAGPVEAARAVAGFCAARGLPADHPLAATALVGEPDIVARRIAEYAAAGVTDLMLGFTDFPATGMIERFARSVSPRLARRPATASGS